MPERSALFKMRCARECLVMLGYPFVDPHGLVSSRVVLGSRVGCCSAAPGPPPGPLGKGAGRGCETSPASPRLLAVVSRVVAWLKRALRSRRSGQYAKVKEQ